MKSKTLLPLRRHQVLRTNDHQEGQDFTSRVWAKHKSCVIEGVDQPTISRVPLGRSFLCFADCPSPLHVEVEGNKTKATVYLLQAGSMKVFAGGKQLSAVPGGPVLIPVKTKFRFQATALKCVLLEASAAKLQSQLAAFGVTKTQIPPLAWDPSAPDARSLTELLGFALRELSRDDSGGSPGIYLLHLESLILSAVARAVASRLPASASPRINGQATQEKIQAWIGENLRRDFSLAELTAFAGVTPPNPRKKLSEIRQLHALPLRERTAHGSGPHRPSRSEKYKDRRGDRDGLQLLPPRPVRLRLPQEIRGNSLRDLEAQPPGPRRLSKKRTQINAPGG